MDNKIEAFNRLMEIRDQMQELIGETESIVRSEFPKDYPNAEAYWIAHIKSALGGYGYHTYSSTFESALDYYERQVYEFGDEDV